ncbi:MAG: hypothetical protein WAV09_01460 [Minisyncoccia bacterium]
MIEHAKRIGLRLSEMEDELAQKGYGKNATPITNDDKSISGLIERNCPRQPR